MSTITTIQSTDKVGDSRSVINTNLSNLNVDKLETSTVGVSVQAYDVDTAKTDVVQEYTAAQNFNATVLTDAASIVWDLNANQVAEVTLAGNRTLSNPSNMKAGGTYILIVKQDTTGGRTLSYGTSYKYAFGEAPQLTTEPNGVDIITFISDGTNMYGVPQYNFS